MNLSIIIPAQNEEEIIEKTVTKIIEEITIPKFEILICNDHSKDQTLKIAKRLEKKYKQVRVVSNPREKGFGNVMRYGFKQAKGIFVVPMMADLCDDPKTVNKMYEKIKEGYDVIVGSRYIKGGGKRNVQNKLKSFLSWLSGQYGRHVKRINTSDMTNAFKMIRRTAVLNIKLKSNNFDLSLELTNKLHKTGCKITEIPTRWTDRTEGESKFILLKEIKRYTRWL